MVVSEEHYSVNTCMHIPIPAKSDMIASREHNVTELAVILKLQISFRTLFV